MTCGAGLVDRPKMILADYAWPVKPLSATGLTETPRKTLGRRELRPPGGSRFLTKLDAALCHCCQLQNNVRLLLAGEQDTLAHG